jgi:hypothetical protein
MIGVIAVLFFLMSPGVIWNYSIDQDKNLVDDKDRSPKGKNQSANKMQVATHAIAFAVIMTFAFPIIKETLGKM